MLIKCKICDKELSTGGFGGHLNYHIKKRDISSNKEYAYKYYTCSNYSGEINYENIMRINNNNLSYTYPDGIYDNISNVPTLAKTNQHFASYLKRKYNISLYDYIEKYFECLTTEEKKKCVFCDHNVDTSLDISYSEMTYSIIQLKTCNRDECKKSIYKKLYPDKKYTPFNFSKIGSNSEYIAMLNSISIEEAKNKKYSPMKVKFDGTLDAYINKYGEEEGTKIYNTRCKKISQNGNMSLKYHINKNGGDYNKGTISYRKRIDSFTRKSINHRSKLECVIYNNLLEYFPNLKQTKRIYCGEKIYYVDMLLKEYDIVIEVMGDYWHCNPDIYERNYYNTSMKKYAHEIWEKDKLRNKNLSEKGLHVIEIWEKDYNTNKELIINNVVEKINERIRI